MKNKAILLLSFVAGILVTLLVPVLVLATGMIDIGADVKPGLIERRFAPWARDRAVARHAPKEKNPHAGDAAVLAAGLRDYKQNCFVCHGAPDMTATPVSQGLNPSAPPLDMEGTDTPDGELFWIIKHGLRMTPMPAFGTTHTDDEIWKLVAFIRHLPDLTPQESQTL